MAVDGGDRGCPHESYIPAMRRLLVWTIAASLAGCRATPNAPLSDSTFVSVMGDLRHLQDTLGRLPDSSMRAIVLRRYRVTADQVEATARALGDDPDRAANVWHAIDRRANEGRPPR